MKSKICQTIQSVSRLFVHLFKRCYKNSKKMANIARFLKYCSKKYLFLRAKTGYDDTVKKRQGAANSTPCVRGRERGHGADRKIDIAH